MILTIIGVILLFLPFIFVLLFKNKIEGFVTILSLIISFELISSLILQAFRIFNYPWVLFIHILALSTLLYKYGKKIKLKKINYEDIDWAIVITIFVIVFSLYSVHFNYTGKYTTATSANYLETENMKYHYPYFSDEWYSIALIDYSISSQGLPTATFLSQDSFLNFQMGFHSFLSQIFLILDITPLTNYVVLSIFFNLLIATMIYLFLKNKKINSWVCAITSISTMYITNGANLSGFWNLIPINLGILSFLIAMFFLSNKKFKMFLLSSFLTAIFYPPLVLFLLISLVFSLIFEKEKKSLSKKTLYLIGVIFISGIIVSLSYYIFMGNYQNAFSNILGKIFYDQLTGEYIPKYSIINIVPIWVLIFAGYSILLKFEDKKLIFPGLMVGISYWIFCAFSIKRILIDYSRAVFFISILITLISGFGLDGLLKDAQYFFKIKKIIKILIFLSIVFLLFFSLKYTENEKWTKLIAENSQGQKISPASPANRYLTQEDLKIFDNLNNISFLSLPWKGTVIGVATKNRPMSAKPGTITIDPNLFYFFMNSNCTEKNKLVNENKINYVYTPYFECEGFSFQKKSSEGLFLYKTNFN